MKKIIFILVFFTGISVATNAQILFSSGQTLQKGAFSVGINPAYTEGSEFALFFHGGYGIGKSADLGLKMGFGWGNPYVGLDFEKSFLKGKTSLSVFAGGHYWHNFGLDLGTIFTFKLKNIYLSTGLDMDINFGKDANDDLDISIPLWLPIEVEFYLQKHLSLIFEADIPLTRPAYTIVSGGLSIYF